MIPKLLILILLFGLVEPFFEVLLDHMEIIEQNTSLIDFSQLKVRKIKKIRSLIGEIKLHIPIGNDIMFELKAYKKQGGEYRLMPYKLQPSPFCDFLAQDSKNWNNLKI